MIFLKLKYSTVHTNTATKMTQKCTFLMKNHLHCKYYYKYKYKYKKKNKSTEKSSLFLCKSTLIKKWKKGKIQFNHNANSFSMLHEGFWLFWLIFDA